ncbi:MAG: hypothetical protein ABI666_01325 [Ferruginibacter sp.]
MRTKFFVFTFILFAGGSLLSSCQKEINLTTGSGSPATPVNQKPKVGTVWTYLYTKYYSFGGVFSIATVVYKAASEETLGGEKWLKVIDQATGATVYLLNEKTGALYQYTNNSSNLFFKYPAVVNDSYSTYNSGSSEDFTVKEVNVTLSTGLGDIVVNHYEGSSGGSLKEELWYNENVWIAWQYVYFQPPFGAPLFRISTLFLQTITY